MMVKGTGRTQKCAVTYDALSESAQYGHGYYECPFWYTNTIHLTQDGCASEKYDANSFRCC